jgi:hypothetical protein
LGDGLRNISSRKTTRTEDNGSSKIGKTGLDKVPRKSWFRFARRGGRTPTNAPDISVERDVVGIAWNVIPIGLGHPVLNRALE